MKSLKKIGLVGVLLINCIYSNKVFVLSKKVVNNTIMGYDLHYIDRQTKTIKNYKIDEFDSNNDPIYVENAKKLYYGHNRNSDYIGRVFDIETENFSDITFNSIPKKYKGGWEYAFVYSLTNTNTYSISVTVKPSLQVPDFAVLIYNLNTKEWRKATQNDDSYHIETDFKRKQVGQFKVFVNSTKGTWTKAGNPYLPKYFFMTNFNISNSSYLNSVVTSTCKLRPMDEAKKIYMRMTTEGKFYVIDEPKKKEYLLQRPNGKNIKEVYGWIISRW